MKRLTMLMLLMTFLSACASTPQGEPPTIRNHIGSRDFPKYKKIAVLPFADAPDAPQSGKVVSWIASQMFDRAGFEVVAPGRLSEMLSRQSLPASGVLDSSQTLRIGKLSGAKAAVMGEVGQYSTHQRIPAAAYIPIQNQDSSMPDNPWKESFVSMSLRIIDTETGRVLYSGAGRYERGLNDPPQQLAERMLSLIIFKWLSGPGTIGYKPHLAPKGVLVTEVFAGSSSQQAGLHPGDLISKINGKSTVNITELELKRLAWFNIGETVTLDVLRGGQNLTIDVVAGSREKVSTASGEVIDDIAPQGYNPEAVAWTEKSTAMAAVKNWSEMIRTASAAIAIDPNYPEAYVSRSWAYLEKGFSAKRNLSMRMRHLRQQFSVAPVRYLATPVC